MGKNTTDLNVVSLDGNLLTLTLAEEIEDDLNEDGTAETLVVNMSDNLTARSR